ncbi:MAG: glycosyltransferase [Bryobacterales bacterium]|nr:glycosyltransferase [Bryobacterales bacterium]
MASPALDSYSIVYFGNDWKAENRTSSHHVARRLAERLPVLYVDCPGLRPPSATTRDVGRLVRKIAEAARGPQPVGPQMWHCTLPQVPFRRLPAFRGLNRRLGPFLLRKWIRQLGWRRLISWFVVPHPGFLAGSLGEDYVVYYCTDDYSALPGVDRTVVARMDEELSRRADQIFAVSEHLLEMKRGVNPSTAYAPHGVDFELFARASDPATPSPETAARLPRPVIGYFGVLGAWIALDLLVYLACSRPHWSFLIVGRVAVDVSDLARLPNLYFVGPQAYESLPQWARAFDVAILPYLHTEQVLAANPLKLKEYLATGKPVVSVWTPEVERFAHYVRIARDREEFLRQIEAALREDTPELARARQAVVAGMTWEARVAECLAVVEQGLARKLAAAQFRRDSEG